MILTVVMKLHRQFLIVTLIKGGGGLTRPLLVTKAISTIQMHMVIGVMALNSLMKDPVAILLGGAMDRDYLTRTRFPILISSFRTKVMTSVVFLVLRSSASKKRLKEMVFLKWEYQYICEEMIMEGRLRCIMILQVFVQRVQLEWTNNHDSIGTRKRDENLIWLLICQGNNE